ncbi:MAG: hypothetical protein ACM3QS_02660 [Bacteroidota bacterium]
MASPNPSHGRRRACLLIPAGFVLLCVLATAVSALSNAALPRGSSVLERLPALEKARLSEALHLRKALGEEVWPGWSEADIPLIVYNEGYAFLIGLANPADGWKKVPALERRGGPWEQVPGEVFEGQPYYRTPITDPQKTPEGFTVLVGERWAATFETREYGEVAFCQGLRADLPPVIRDVIPVRLAWEALMGKTESYIAALEHESFHAYEGMAAPDRLAASERMYSVAETYPFDGMAESWEREMEALVQAARAADGDQARTLARQFLELRAERRAGLTPGQVELERLREWEEGLAKYAELEISRRAGTEAGYRPVEGILADPDFKSYAGQEQFWLQQLGEAKNTQGRSGDARFYYSGNALAVVLDRLLPGWKLRALPGGEYLDDLLVKAVR